MASNGPWCQCGQSCTQVGGGAGLGEGRRSGSLQVNQGLGGAGGRRRGGEEDSGAVAIYDQRSRRVKRRSQETLLPEAWPGAGNTLIAVLEESVDILY